MGKADILEANSSALKQQRSGVRRVGDIGFQRQGLIDPLHVDGALLDFAIGPAEDVERLIDIHQHQRDCRHIASAQHAVERLPAGRQGHRQQSGIHDQRLQAVEQGQRGLRLRCRPGIALHRAVIGIALAFLGGKGFHGFEIDQPVHGAGGGLVVGIIHLPANADAPFGHRPGQRHVDDNGDHRDDREFPTVFGAQYNRRQGQLEQGRGDVEDQEAHQEINSPGAALDDPLERTGALGLVIADRQALDMGEGAHGGQPLGVLADRREHGVAQLRRTDREEAGDGVGDEGQGESGQQARPQGAGLTRLRGRGIARRVNNQVDAVTEQDRRRHREQLGNDGQDQRQPHAEAPFRHFRRGQQREQAPHRLAERALRRLLGIFLAIGLGRSHRGER